jgi:hypothetical protein
MKINWRASSLHAAVIGLCNSILQAASAFGAHLTASQNVSITAICNSLLVILSLTVIGVTNGNGTHP